MTTRATTRAPAAGFFFQSFRWVLSTLCFVCYIQLFSITATIAPVVTEAFVGKAPRFGRPLPTTLATELTMAMPTRSLFRVLGVCGGIGSGKSKACQLLVDELGCRLHLDADSLAHRVYKPQSPVLEEICTAFSNQDLVTDQGELNRKALGAVVFADPSAMGRLERIVWPHVKTEIQEQIRIEERRIQEEDGDEKAPVVVVLEAAVLIDAGWMDLLDGLWVVEASPEVSLQRLVEHRGMTKEDAQKRMEAQQSRRGIGNLQEEVHDGIVSAVIKNDEGTEALQANLKAALEDPSCWYPVSS